MRLLAAAALCCVCGPALAADPKDAKNCTDSPVMSRFPGSRIEYCKEVNFDQVKMPKLKDPVEGHVKIVGYRVPKGHTQLELGRNWGNALRGAGYTLDHEAKDGREVVAHKGPLWVYMLSADETYRQTIVEQKDMQQQVVADAKALENSLAATGHVTANGILFDTDRADLKPESKPALDEIAKLLRSDSNLRIYVVGHTDNQGALAHNVELSKARAASVVKALETQYSIPNARLASYGDGPYAPVASNDSEDGRAQNRRVELVKQ